MISTELVVLTTILIILGVNFIANNILNSLIVNYVFYNDKLSITMLRIIGIVMIAGSLLLLIGYKDVFYLIVLFDIMLFIFFTIKGRNKSKLISQMKLQKAIEAKEKYLATKQAELAEKEATRSSEEMIEKEEGENKE